MIPIPVFLALHTLQQAPAAAAATARSSSIQISSYQGLWFGSESETSTNRRISVEGLRVTVSEKCLPFGDGQCNYEAEGVPYAPLRATSTDSSVSALLVDYGDKGWRQSLVLRHEASGRLEAFVYTSYVDVPGRKNTYERQSLIMGVMARPAMPQFPWPPPPPTVSLRLPDKLVATPGRDSLGTVFDRLRVALARVDVGWWSVYAIGTNGFAVVTRLEAIESDGRPKPGPARWNTPQDRVPREIKGVTDYIRALVSANPGFYRVMVLAVTDRPSQSAGEPISADSAGRLLRGGTDQLPLSMRRVPLGPDGRCLALIYEFQRPTEHDSARLVTNAAIGPLQHLSLSGLWTEQELRP